MISVKHHSIFLHGVLSMLFNKYRAKPIVRHQQEERSDIRQTQREIQQIIGRSEAKNCRKTEDTLREMKISN